VIVVGALEVDPADGRAHLCGDELKLRPLESRVLVELASKPDRVVTRRAIAEALWGEDSTVDIRSVDAFVTRIRRALGDASDCIVTVRRVGYRLDPERLARVA
jgi:two-component system phosphate regulon response regulator PhoB